MHARSHKNIDVNIQSIYFDAVINVYIKEDIHKYSGKRWVGFKACICILVVSVEKLLQLFYNTFPIY